jgi:TRAP-type transport system periplasmic protein
MKLTIGVLGLCAFAAPAIAEERLIFGTAIPPTHMISVQLHTPLMECISSATGGAVQFDFFPSAQLVKHDTAVEGIASGVVDVTYLNLGTVAGDLPLHGITALPGTAGTPTQSLAGYRSARAAVPELEAELTGKGMRALIYNPFPPHQFLSRTTPIATVADVAGKKIRIAGGAFNAFMTQIGGVPIEMPAGDIYLSLQQGVLDAVALPISSIMSYKLNEVISSASSNANLGQGAGLVVISTAAWDALDDTARTAFTTCSLEAEDRIAAALESEVETTLALLVGQGIEVFELAPEDLVALHDAMDDAAIEYVERIAARNPTAQKVYDALVAGLQ